MAFTIQIIDGKLVIGAGGESAVRHERPEKGHSLMTIVDDFIAIDVETTGLSPDYDDIIEMSAVHYLKGQRAEAFSQLVNPGYSIPEFITELTGITDEMMVGQPALDVVLPRFLEFVGDQVLVGHNVNFDINFIYDACEELGLPPFGNDFIDTMRVARRLHPEYENHRLQTCIKKIGLPKRGLHRAEDDADLCAQVYLKMIEDPDFEEKTAPAARKHAPQLKAGDIVAQEGFINEDSPFYGKVCVFTGALESFTRKEAFQLVADIGGIPGDGVTQKTNFLILGNNDYCTTIKDGKSAKQKKAEKLIAAGADLQIIPESVFLEMLADDLRQS